VGAFAKTFSSVKFGSLMKFPQNFLRNITLNFRGKKSAEKSYKQLIPEVSPGQLGDAARAVADGDREFDQAAVGS
jgi:hypothetical protein